MEALTFIIMAATCLALLWRQEKILHHLTRRGTHGAPMGQPENHVPQSDDAGTHDA